MSLSFIVTEMLPPVYESRPDLKVNDLELSFNSNTAVVITAHVRSTSIAINDKRRIFRDVDCREDFSGGNDSQRLFSHQQRQTNTYR